MEPLDNRKDRAIKLTAQVSCAGWASKVGPEVLGKILNKFSLPTSEKLLVGIEGVDDAGVYQLSDDMALVQTVDFFPPIVDDPYIFGQVAAANALSDVYAMGGTPITALNILGFPAGMSPDIVAEVLRGGADKIAEAGAVIVGGHSIKDNELKYGLAVTGLIHPKRIVANSGARPGDHLILTKPIGTGIVSTALKHNLAKAENVKKMTETMTMLNKVGCEAMTEFEAHAATDITGFGLSGHAYEMASASGVSLEIRFDQVRLLPGAIEYAKAGALTGGASANQRYLEGKVTFVSPREKYVYDLLYDAQTSGGLLIAVGENEAQGLLDYLLEKGIDASDIGRVIPAGDTAIYIL